jgi:hypothetical protein
MSTLSLWLQCDRMTDEDIAANFAEFDVAVVDPGVRAEAGQRADTIRELTNPSGSETDLIHLREIFGPDGRRCTHRPHDLARGDLYRQFDLLFPASGVDMVTLFEGVAQLIADWRVRGCPKHHTVVVPHNPPSDDE